VDPEESETGEVVSGGEQPEVGVDANPAAHPGPSAPVTASHEVGELALDFRARGSVVVVPRRIGLSGPRPGELSLVG